MKQTLSSLECNIVEVEFFHVGGKNISTLKALTQEIREWHADGGTIETSVRFMDESGDITRIAQKWHAAKVQHDAIRQKFGSTKNRLWRWYLSRQARSLLRVMKRKSEECFWQVQTDLRSSVNNRRTIGIEQSNRSFRLVHENEFYELLQSIEHSKSSRVFVFKPNDILANKNVGVAWIM